MSLRSLTSAENVRLENKLAQKSTPLHERIRSEIEKKIMSGEWPIGHRIPFEVSLAKHYGCSRMTVNKALTELARAGLIARIKRSGSFVSQPQSQAAVLEINDIRKEVESLSLTYAFSIIRSIRRSATKEDVSGLEILPGTPVLELECVHLAAGKPFCFEQRLINLDVVPTAEGVDFQDVTPGQWLLNQVPWSSAEHRIHAAAADKATSAALALEEGAACLVVERRTWSNAGPVTHVQLTYPGYGHALVATFTPTS